MPCMTEFLLKIFNKIDLFDFPLQRKFDPEIKWRAEDILESLSSHNLTPYRAKFTYEKLIEKGKQIDSPVIFSWPKTVIELTQDPTVRDMSHWHMFYLSFEEDGMSPGFGTFEPKGLFAYPINHNLYSRLYQEFGFEFDSFWVDETP